MTTPPDRLGQRIHQGIKAEIAPLFDELRRFTDRRIAELSAEIHATVQLVDFSEVNLSNQLAKIQEQVAVMVAMVSEKIAPAFISLSPLRPPCVPFGARSDRDRAA